MQLKKLFIKDYKILKDFTIEFPYDSKKYISVFIGANGSGKSTILEAIAEIFSALFFQDYPKFDFEIEYSIRHYSQTPRNYPHADVKGQNLLIKIVGKKGAPYYIEENDGSGFASVGLNNMYPTNLPENVVIYYAGLSEIMEVLCKPHEDKLSKAYRKGNTDINRDFFYYRPEHFGIILLSLLSFEYGDIPEFLRSKAKIQGMKSVQIRLKKPKWQSKDTIENFWGAEGEVRKFLDYLKEHTNSPDNLKNPGSSSRKGSIVIEPRQDDTLIITITSLERLFEIREFLMEERKLFEILNIMLADGLLADITFSLVKSDDGKSQIFNVLSEGEQQAITIKGLTELLAGKNTLFLFDEPDTYLHPGWQRMFISEIQTMIENSEDSENYFLIATHSPNIVSGVKNESLFVLERGVIKEIPFNSYGKNVDSLLIDFFDVEGVRNQYVENLLNEVQELVKNKKYDSEDFKSKFNELKEILHPTAPEIVNINLEIAKSHRK